MHVRITIDNTPFDEPRQADSTDGKEQEDDCFNELKEYGLEG
jgi:hypothetical protein